MIRNECTDEKLNLNIQCSPTTLTPDIRTNSSFTPAISKSKSMLNVIIDPPEASLNEFDNNNNGHFVSNRYLNPRKFLSKRNLATFSMNDKSHKVLATQYNHSNTLELSQKNIRSFKSKVQNFIVINSFQ